MIYMRVEDTKPNKKYYSLIIILFMIILLFNLWVLIDVYRTYEYTKPFYWIGLIFLGAIGYYWYEFLNFLNKNIYYKWSVILIGPFLYYLNKADKIPFLNSFLISAPISPLMAMLRVLIITIGKQSNSSSSIFKLN